MVPEDLVLKTAPLKASLSPINGPVGLPAMPLRTFSAIVHREDDLYVAECPEVGTVSQGTTIEEAVANLKEATELYLEEFPIPAGERPLLTTFEVAVGQSS
jgi:predicted RNase H-like HicB family nuclease